MTENKAEKHHVTDEEQKEKAAGGRQKEDSAVKKKRRKGKLKHKELIFGGTPDDIIQAQISSRINRF